MGERRATKSPLKNRPLRSPGQSLQDSLNDLFLAKVGFWIFLPTLFILIAGLEWLQKLTGISPQPWLMTIAAAFVVALAVWRITANLPKLRQLQLGRDGERVVGQLLEELRADGYEVLHDIPGDGYNIDHALVGPSGVFAIETKTVRKPKGDQRVIFSGEAITVAGLTPDRDPIAQVRAAARELGRIVRDRSGLDTPVKPVVLYPGWYTESSGKSDVWVLNETVFPKWLANEDVKLSDIQVRQISTGIARHVWDAEN